MTEDEKYVITCGYDKCIKVWDTSNGFLVKAIEGSPSSITSLALSNDESYLALGCTHNYMTLWKNENSSFYRVKVFQQIKGSVSHI